MSLAEVDARYTGGGKPWVHDGRFIPNTQTGTIMAKPADARGQATEVFTLLDGQTVGIVRAVNEDAAAFKASADQSTLAYGAPTAEPPAWAMHYELFRKWHKTPNEDARFWSNEQDRTVLTAALSPSGHEAIYMLINLPGLQAAQGALNKAGASTAPEPSAVPPAPPATPPGAADNPGSTPGGQ
jgi:hypothetical protein